MMTAFKRGLWPGVAGCLSKQTTYGQFYSFAGAADCAFARFVLGKGIVELKGAEVAAATAPPTARPLPKAHTEGRTLVLEADSIGFDVWAGSQRRRGNLGSHDARRFLGQAT